eukprot:scaffold1485_cov171-Amphora_coffeaeformis.AAC.26
MSHVDANAAARRSTSHPLRTLWMMVMVLLLAQESFSFTLEMSYKPPVKSTVKKLHERRFLSDQSSGESSSRRPESRKSAHAASFAPPASGPNFEQRMRDLMFRPETKKDSIPTRRSISIPSNVVTVNSLQEYKTVVGDESSRIVAVRFHATYCRACMAVAPHFYKIAKMNPDVVFVDVPVTQANAALHQGLGVPSLPYGHIYHPQSGLVEEMKLTRKDIPDFREKLKSYSEGNCDVSP